MNSITTSIMIHRRLLQLSEPDPFDSIPDPSFSPVAADDQPTNTSLGRPLDPAAPFDSSMALTILVLVFALFFLGFFSAYIRPYAGANSDDASPPSSSSLRRPQPQKEGLDASAVNSLPLVAYGKSPKHPMIDDCPICLNEFDETETVKLIPYCSHVFHPGCIDTWLASHVTCPLCRSAQLFKRVDDVCLDVTQDKNVVGATEIAQRSTAENGDASRQVGPAGVRRACSCYNLSDRAVLQRSTSF